MFGSCFNKDFGQMIIDERKTQGITQARLAKKLRFSAQFLGRIEKGIAPMPAKSLKRVVKILGIDRNAIASMAGTCAKIEALRLLR